MVPAARATRYSLQTHFDDVVLGSHSYEEDLLNQTWRARELTPLSVRVKDSRSSLEPQMQTDYVALVNPTDCGSSNHPGGAQCEM
jgi:hypothetical protein